jgi:UDP-N-acetylmuramate dehydrogenase
MHDPVALFRALDARLLDYEKHAPLAPLLSMKTGGPAAALFRAPNLPSLAAALSAARESSSPVLFLGGGANLLVRDGGFPGLVVQLSGEFSSLDTLADGTWYAGAALPLQRLFDRAKDEARERFAFLGGIPGTVGGAVTMNAGTDLGWMDSVVLAVDLLLPDGSPQRLPREALGFAYRKSALPEGAIVTGAQLDPGPVAPNPDEFRSLLKTRGEKRRRSQPVQQPTSGSTFTNPPGDFAGRLIEAAGLKGLRIGGAEISPLHANFIVNPERRATTADVLALMARAQRIVAEKFAVTLVLEVRVVGVSREGADDDEPHFQPHDPSAVAERVQALVEQPETP